MFDSKALVLKIRYLSILVVSPHLYLFFLLWKQDYPSCVLILEPLSKSSDPQLLSLISRLHLQAGSLSSSSKLIHLAKVKAEERISQLEETSNNSSQEETQLSKMEILSLKNLIITNEALLLISMGRFKDARETLLSFERDNRDQIVQEGGGNLTSLLNNLAITAFYSGELEKVSGKELDRTSHLSMMFRI